MTVMIYVIVLVDRDWPRAKESKTPRRKRNPREMRALPNLVPELSGSSRTGEFISGRVLINY